MSTLVSKIFFFSFMLWVSFINAQTTVTLSPSQDAAIGFHDGFNSANTNYETADYFAAFYQPGAISGDNGGRALMDFDFAIVPAGVLILSAKLNLFGRGSYGVGEAVSHGNYGQNESYLQRITSPWTENAVTWNTQPTSVTLDQVLLPASTDSIEDYTNIDVTNLVQDIFNDPTNSYGILIRLVSEISTRSIAFCSSDFADSSKHPQLIITYICNGTMQVVKYPSHDAAIGFHDGFNSANTNYKNADYYSAFSQPGAIMGENAGEGLMDFDLSDIPGNTILSATLDLYGRGSYGVGDAVSIGNVGQNISYLQRIISTWNESTVTWNTQPPSTIVHEIVLPASNLAIEDYIGIDVTQMVQDMVDSPSYSYGFKILLQTEDPTRSMAFCSIDYPDSTKFPKLTINYTCEKSTNVASVDGELISRVFPTVTDNNIKIDVCSSCLTDHPIFFIFDLTGKQLLAKQIQLTSTTLNIKSLSKGVLIYKIATDIVTSSGKIILK